MERRRIAHTDLTVPVVGYGASSIGQEFRSVDLNQAMESVRAALDVGMNFIDTAPFYGRGMSEVLLGIILRDVPRDNYVLQTKLGRYDKNHFDFSAKRVAESIDVSLHRLGTDHLDIVLCHDIEFVDLRQIVDETLPALRKEQAKGKVRYVGISGYPMKIFTTILNQAPLDVVMSYNHFTLQNTQFADLLPFLKSKQVGILNAAPFSARLLTNDPLPPWHKAPPEVRAVAQAAAKVCIDHGTDLAKLALQYSLTNPDMSSCVTGSANPTRVREWAKWAAESIDQPLLAEVLEVLKPIHNWRYTEGKPENNEA